MKNESMRGQEWIETDQKVIAAIHMRGGVSRVIQGKAMHVRREMGEFKKLYSIFFRKSDLSKKQLYRYDPLKFFYSYPQPRSRSMAPAHLLALHLHKLHYPEIFSVSHKHEGSSGPQMFPHA